jgi:2-polyprenyl-3-methyl-5-hydroxy-6-metoxy-1,4-benzoquinol methylase
VPENDSKDSKFSQIGCAVHSPPVFYSATACQGEFRYFYATGAAMPSNASHWDAVFSAKETKDRSWYQQVPATSLAMLDQCRLTPDARIIDVGAGDSRLPDFLLERGFRDITILDISATAIETIKRRLSNWSHALQFVVSDVLDYEPERRFDAWHDRAAFHFLVTDAQVQRYADLVANAVRPGCHLIIGTFSRTGPKKCSGLDVRQYDQPQLEKVFHDAFALQDVRQETHITPAGQAQDFIFCRFQRRYSDV